MAKVDNDPPFREDFISKSKGRGLIATRPIPKGTTIFKEDPLVCAQFSWNKLYGYRACDHCMAALETAEENLRRLTKIPDLVLPGKHLDEMDPSTHVQCSRCGVGYCSEECRDEAWSRYHVILCPGCSGADETHPANILDELWRNTHYPPETAGIQIFTRMLAMVRIDPQMKTVFSKLCQRTKTEDGQFTHKLLGERFQCQRSQIREALLQFLHFEDMEDWLSEEGFPTFLALVGQNSQGIGTNSFSSWYQNVDRLSESEKIQLEEFVDEIYEKIEEETGTDFMNNEGAGLYRLQSACNHSCDPNAEVTFPSRNNSLALVATADLEAGEEICISYLEECQRSRSRHSRNKILRENYLFECDCAKCGDETDQPDETSDEDESDHD